MVTVALATMEAYGLGLGLTSHHLQQLHNLQQFHAHQSTYPHHPLANRDHHYNHNQHQQQPHRPSPLVSFLAQQHHQPGLHHQQSSSPSPSPSPQPSSGPSEPQPQPQQQSSSLRFSMVNILRPDFGRKAILSSWALDKPARRSRETSRSPSSHSVSSGPSITPAPNTNGGTSHQSVVGSHSPGAVSGSCGRTSVRSPGSAGLSRSASLESLASSRSSVAGSVAPSVCSSLGTAESPGGSATSSAGGGDQGGSGTATGQSLWPAWIYCTRYSDRPSSGPRSRRMKRPSTSGKSPSEKSSPSTCSKSSAAVAEDKRPRTAFSPEQLARLRSEFEENKYLSEARRQKLSRDLGLNENQIKIWFQNKRAKIKKARGEKNPLALQLMAQGLYNHSTVPVDENGEEILPDKDC